MMNRSYIPRPPLSRFVQQIWYWQSEPQPHPRERLLPNGETSIIFNLNDDPIRNYDPAHPDRFETLGLASVSGAHTRPFIIDTAQATHVIGIQFQPGGAFPFFALPSSELQNAHVSLETLWHVRAGEVRDRLLHAPSVDHMFRILEAALLASVTRPLDLDPSVEFALHHFRRQPHGITVASVTGHIGMSQRRFIQLFHDQVGITPKAFCRVRRFQRVLSAIRAARAIDWARIALDFGYYDQSHFIHEFQEFSGFTPSAYIALATPHLNHVPLKE
jgi:AraC-like DNA-binding protein